MPSTEQENNHFAAIIDGLATQGFAVIPHFMPAAQVQQLAQRALALQQADMFKPANTGKQTLHNREIRGDATFWLDEHSENPAEQTYLTTLQALQTALNRALFLGLHEVECHFAHYPVGAFYKKHLDQFNSDPFKKDAVRQISSILYLNETWADDDGGALRIYLDEADAHKTLDIAPHGGTLVVFLSARFYHEVLPAKRARLSLTAWFKTR